MHALLVTVDARYAAILPVFLRCLHRNYPNHPQVVVCTSGWAPHMFGPLDREFPFLRWVDAATLRFPIGPPMRHDVSMDRPIMYARWAAFTPAFDIYDTVVYLDVDTLVLAPLDRLLATERALAFEDAYPDVDTLIFRDPNDDDLRELLRQDGLDGHEWHAANAGVIALPRRDRRREHLLEAERLATRYAPYLMWGDQSVFNLWLARNALRPVRDFRFNYQVRLILERRECNLYRHAKVLHFNGQGAAMPLLMALASAIIRLPGGRRLVPTALRLAMRPDLEELPGYRVRRWLRTHLLRSLK